MGGTNGIRRRAQRVLVTTGLMLLATGFVSESALAQLPLGAPSGSAVPTSSSAGFTDTVTQTTAPVVQTATQATAPVTQAVEPVTQTATQALASTTQTTAPVVQTATQATAQAAEPVLASATPVLEAVQPVLAGAAPVLQVAQPLTGGSPPLLETARSILDATSPAVGSATRTPATQSAPTSTAPAGVGSEPTSASAEAGSTPAPSAETGFGETVASPAPDVASAAVTPRDRAMASRPPVRNAWPVVAGPPSTWRTSARHAGEENGPPRATAPRRPLFPSAPPSGPLGFLAAISATFGSSAALLFAVTLVAALSLAAPGLSRRLRLGLAPWPLPIPLASLERPG